MVCLKLILKFESLHSSVDSRVTSFEYGQLSTHKNVGVQEMTSVAPRHLAKVVFRGLLHYILQLLHSIPPIRLKGIAFKTMGTQGH